MMKTICFATILPQSPCPDYRTESELQGLFHQENALTKLNWHEHLGIFIHSRHDFETVFNHLRKFPVLQDEHGKWFFFRFYDPKVLHNYLNIIANSPEKLSKFFGFDNRIIHAFGAGFDDSFYYYQLKALPEDTKPAPVMMTQWEMDGFKALKWLETRENLAGYVLQTYPHLVSQEQLGELLDYLSEAYKKNYQAQDAIMKYAVAKLVAKAKQYDFDMAEMRLTQQFNELANVANQLWSDIVEE
ncbi:DUF4123 domain-containing protein [Actinobacillus vicugnae]|uniref:DUF4123 domain-containing protein n=1 Tax=Actinobacillus vicugnae TaxID=2573093 RepID=UPI001FCAC2EA|nr:DUF4123 domain-containing protein [Actinobacillus vicugnae]